MSFVVHILTVIADVLANLAAASVVAAGAVVVKRAYSDSQRAALLLLNMIMGMLFVLLSSYIRTKVVI